MQRLSKDSAQCDSGHYEKVPFATDCLFSSYLEQAWRPALITARAPSCNRGLRMANGQASLKALWLDGDLMHHPARPLRLDNVAEALKCRGIRSASAPHRVQPVSRKAAKLDEAPLTKRRSASGSGQQEVVGERRQVIKAAIRGLVEAALPDLSPAQVDAVVAEVNKRMTMGSKQCCITAVLCLSMLLQSFLGQPTAGFPAAGPAPSAPPPPDPACPSYTHPHLATRSSPRSAAAPAQLPPPVQLNILDPKLLSQIKDAMELLNTARVLEHLMRGPHDSGIKLLPAEVAVFEQPSSAWPVAMLQQLDEVRLTGDGISLNANATKISTSINEFYRHPGRFIKWWGKAIGVVEGGLDYSLPDREHRWRLSVNSVLRQPRLVAEVAKHRSLLGLEARWLEGVDYIRKGGAGRLPLEKRVRYALFVNRSLEGWQQHDTCPRPFTMLPMVGVRARHFVIDDRVLHGVLADLGMTTLTRPQVEADSLPQWQRFIQYSQLQNSGWDFARRVETDGVSISVHFVRSQVVKEPVDLPFIGRWAVGNKSEDYCTPYAVNFGIKCMAEVDGALGSMGLPKGISLVSPLMDNQNLLNTMKELLDEEDRERNLYIAFEKVSPSAACCIAACEDNAQGCGCRAAVGDPPAIVQSRLYSRIAARVLCRPMYVGASGSGQQEVVGERRQVIKAAIRGLVEAALPDLSPEYAAPCPIPPAPQEPVALAPRMPVTSLLPPCSPASLQLSTTMPAVNQQPAPIPTLAAAPLRPQPHHLRASAPAASAARAATRSLSGCGPLAGTARISWC
ncbi:hypothetical protein QJQ45_025921 [Haematococcus lacustris]|nr:hypothetical protein QJQ45_025921 [Haematococcus lacustris]